MNYLAHAYLSFNRPPIVVGNMISDFVKGRQKFSFSGSIQQGINLHRELDAFTDSHPATKKAMEVFRPAYRLYSGAIVDVLYDHFLATDEKIFGPGELHAFSLQTYAHLEAHAVELPPRFLLMFTYMKQDNWLFHYQYKEGIEKSLRGLVRRAAYLSESETAFRLFEEHYAFLRACYEDFFEDVKGMAKQKLINLV